MRKPPPEPRREILPGDAILCAGGAAVLTVLRMVRNGESTDDLEQAARVAIEVSTR